MPCHAGHGKKMASAPPGSDTKCAPISLTEQLAKRAPISLTEQLTKCAPISPAEQLPKCAPISLAEQLTKCAPTPLTEQFTKSAPISLTEQFTKCAPISLTEQLSKCNPLSLTEHLTKCAPISLCAIACYFKKTSVMYQLDIIPKPSHEIQVAISKLLYSNSSKCESCGMDIQSNVTVTQKDANGWTVFKM